MHISKNFLAQQNQIMTLVKRYTKMINNNSHY